MKKENWAAKLKRENKELKQKLDALTLDTSDNIYTAEENKTISFYKYWFYASIILGIGYFISKLV